MERRKSGENGAVTVEATISLTAFMFAIITILTIVNISLVQAKIAIAIFCVILGCYNIRNLYKQDRMK